MLGFVDRTQWKTFLGEFSKRNQLRPAHLEVVGDIGAQIAEEHLPFVGVGFETKGHNAGSVEIALGGETAADERHLSHLVSNVERIAPLIGTNGMEDGLGIEDQNGVKTILRFETLPEIENRELRERRQLVH
ncbi:MAG TPA: DUF5335 family protein [Pyrinomonadaceae bacterium]|jgi:hypothetical protein